MGMSKRMWEQWMEEMFSSFDTERIFRLQQEDLENLSVEKVKFTKGNCETEVEIYFNKNGEVVQTKAVSKVTKREPTNEELQKLLTEAVEAEDYSKAAEIQKQLKLLEKPTK